MATIQSRAPRERSETIKTMVEAEGTGPYTVHADCILTRRKRHHIIENSEGGVAFRSRWFSDILEWLAQRGENSYFLQTNRTRFAVEVVHKGRVKGRF